MAEITVKWIGSRRIIKTIIGTDTGVARDMLRRGINVQSAAKRNVHRMGAVDTGRLLNSIVVRQEEALGVDRVKTTVGSDLEYAIFVHEGRRPGGRMPPVSAIEDWARRNGMAGAGFPIARAIARRGIRGRPFLKDALAAAEG